MTDLSELLERVRKATGPDRDLDRAIWRTFGGQVIPMEERGGHTYERWLAKAGDSWPARETRITASIDAALALVERELPGQGPVILKQAIEEVHHRLAGILDGAQDEWLKLLPLAILAALLQAKFNLIIQH